ncbi:MAG TPA: type II secretion system protein [Pirellulales bacterium]|jgi:prepilin-type N-terminal cleavage/methylation domain-containing protein/prepilin-type processing-associated H-X9-DG protein
MCRKAFSLVELLVVMAIIGMLVGLLVPAVQASRESARTTNCASNLRQVGLAMTRYCDTYHGRWPETTHTVEADPVTGRYDKAWIYTIAPYTEAVDEIRICASDLAGDLRLHGKGTSYTMNGYLSKESRPAFDNRRKVKSMSKTVVAFELAENKDQGAMRTQNPADIDVFNDHVHSFSWFTTSNINKNLVFTAISAEIALDRHSDTTHLLYADGHLQRVPVEQVREWTEPATIFNFALPPS